VDRARDHLQCLSGVPLVYRFIASCFIFESPLVNMNWTGGQLHRSARQGTLSKNQRQNFAKSRQVAIDRASRHLSPFPGFPGFPGFPNARDRQSAACKEGRDVAIDAKSVS